MWICRLYDMPNVPVFMPNDMPNVRPDNIDMNTCRVRYRVARHGAHFVGTHFVGAHFVGAHFAIADVEPRFKAEPKDDFAHKKIT